jgi:2'-5' RNA ligase
MRTFIAIDFPEEIREKILKIQNLLPEFKGKKTEFENLHLTLKFLGEVDEEKIKEIKEKLKKINLKKFKAEINSIGVFSEKFIRIIWLGIRNCEQLQREIDEKLSGIFEREKRFMGHLTIARIKSIADKKKFLRKLNEIKIPRVKFIVNNFSLKKSILTEKKPVYENIDVYSLD